MGKKIISFHIKVTELFNGQIMEKIVNFENFYGSFEQQILDIYKLQNLINFTNFHSMKTGKKELKTKII